MAQNTFTSDKRLYLDKDGKVVGEDSPDRVSLLVAAGASIPMEKAEQYGLTQEAVVEAAAVEEEAPKKTASKKK